MLIDRFADALSYAAHVHRGQTRRGAPLVALRVTLADKVDNVRAILNESDPSRPRLILKTRAGSYTRLARLFAQTSSGARADGLAVIARELQRKTRLAVVRDDDVGGLRGRDIGVEHREDPTAIAPRRVARA